MQVHDLPCTSPIVSIANNPLSDSHFSTRAMASDPQPSAPTPIQSPNHHKINTKNSKNNNSITSNNNHDQINSTINKNNNDNNNINDSSSIGIVRRERPSRACTQRAAARMQAAAAAEAAAAAADKKQKKAASRRQRLTGRLLKEEVEEEEEEEAKDEDNDEEGEDGDSPSGAFRNQQCNKIVTPLLGEPELSQLPRWSIRGMWQLASILNFLNVFRHLLNIKVEFSAEEFETALISPNNSLGDIHIPLLKAIPPITRMALGHNTWVTVLCRKLRDWWLWVAEGELPIVASHGAEVEAYNALDPAVRVIILKALCDIRVEQEDIRTYVDNSIKHGVHLSAFRKERIGGDSHGISYWYEDDAMVGHRLYREFRKVEVKKGKGRNIPPIPNSSYQWETVATNLDEFQNVSEKLFLSKNRTEASLGKKLKNDMLPEIENVHKRKEKLLKKQHRQALMLDSMMNMDGLAAGRSLRDRKPVTYTFDDYDRSINEAIKITKKQQPCPEPTTTKREAGMRLEAPINGRWAGPSQSFNALSPKSPDYDGFFDDNTEDQLDRSIRRRQRPQRYSAKEFVEGVSDNEADFDSDDDIVGEVIYDDEYLRQRKQRKISSSSEGDDEYHWDDDNPEEEEEEEDEDDDDSLSASEDSDEPWKFKKFPGRTRRETKLRSVDEIHLGLRRSKRASRNRINYRQYELSESETDLMKPGKLNASEHSNESENTEEFSMASQDSEKNTDYQEMEVDEPVKAEEPEMVKKEENNIPEKENSLPEDEGDGVQKRRFLDLNQLAPGSGFDDGPNSIMKDEDANDF
ncbi:hypothetical protein ACH5RR_025946 [Cinchona calisaya]|uniref:DDT domain-containing protein n=1 Tax=Cinchona calisaya TaxID=153742 RepID=A0ABD2Z273_9GENT